jgi:hypothetical protein
MKRILLLIVAIVVVAVAFKPSGELAVDTMIHLWLCS